MENFAYSELNKSSRSKDSSKIPTLGPWAFALGKIICLAQTNRIDLEKFDHRKQYDLWRGGGITDEEIQEYTQMVGKREKDGIIFLFGYTSCSLDKSVAGSFMWEDKEDGHSKVLYRVKWK